MSANFRRQIWHVGDGPQSRISATASSHVAIAEPLRLLHLEVLLEFPPDLYVMLFDTLGLPLDGANPDWRGVAKGKDLTSMKFLVGDGLYYHGIRFEAGLVACLSSTPDTLTLSERTAHWQGIIRIDGCHEE